MARREHQFFNLSFLDILSGALGAMLFLFIVVDKGGTHHKKPVPVPIKAVYLDIDTSLHQLHGILPDSLAKMLTGDSVIVVINAVKSIPGQVQCPTCEECKPCKQCKPCGDKCPDPDHHKHPICIDPERHKKPLCGDINCKACPDPSVHGKPLCDSPDCDRGNRTIYVGDPIAFAYKLGFSLTASNEEDEIDLQVCRDDGVCVFGGRRNDGGMKWLNLKDNCLFGSARKWNEIIVSENTLKPGNYTIYGRLGGKTERSNSELVVATKKAGVVVDMEKFSTVINKGNKWNTIGTVKVGADYSISKK